MTLRFLLLSFLGSALAAYAQTGHTPKAGSTERQAICDAARVHVLSRYATQELPQPIVFKIERIRATEEFANLEAVPLFKDGRYAAPEYLPDVVFNLCLKKGPSGWQVVTDLSRTDVPDAAEAAALRRRLPEGFPLTILSPEWQKLLAP